MTEGEPASHVFSSHQLWQQPSLFREEDTFESALFTPLQLDISAIKFDHPYASKHDLERELRLPDLETFQFGPLPELESLDESSVSVETPPLEPEEDIWQVALELGPANKDVQFFTWESFEKGQHIPEQTPYISERGPEFFDAALACDEEKVTAGQIIKGNVLLQSLWNLGLGRSSILFQFNQKLKTFESAVENGRASGISLLASQSLIAQFIHIGNTFLYLRSFAERTFVSPTSLPARVALATAVSSILSSIEDTLGRRSLHIASLIQLQDHFTKPREIITHVARMVDAAKYAKTNEQLASILHHRLLELEEDQDYLRQLSCQILALVSGPSLDLLAEWAGLRQGQSTEPIWLRDSFVAVEDASVDANALEFTYRSELMPRFVSPEDGSAIFELGSSLHFLRTQHPRHPLSRLHTSAIEAPKLGWAFEWQDIEAISIIAKAYEETLRQALLDYGQGQEPLRKRDADSAWALSEPKSEFHEAMSDMKEDFEKALHLMDAFPTQNLHQLPDDLQVLLSDILNDRDKDGNLPSQTFSPPLALASALSFRPIITAQAKVVNAATIRLFFRVHSLRLHLSVQRQYHLLGDGVFSSLLATALFDPERESAERHKGRMRSGVHMGLQLGARKSWPPASSELRLALRGVLSESYYSSALYQSTLNNDEAQPNTPHAPIGENDELPGQLNFAIRNLTEAEQEKVMDPDALAALDFLRLQYVAPTPLHLIITPASLDKYDTIFKFLLRLLRLLYVVSHLPRHYQDPASRQFRTEAHHFVTAFATYVFQTGIAQHWDSFDAFVRTIEQRIAHEDAAHQLGVSVTEGVAAIRDAHERCLDGILFSLLLRKRQRKVLALVEDIFGAILAFAKGVHGDEGAERVHVQLRGKIKVFVGVCRGLAGKKGYGSSTGAGPGAAAGSKEEENAMERLVLAMEMNAYYT